MPSSPPSLSQQQQQLLKAGPQNGIPLPIMERVVEGLCQAAKSLEHGSYALLQQPDGGWLVIEGSSGGSWIPAFGHRQDAEQARERLGLKGLKIEVLGVLDALFLLWGAESSTGILFYDIQGNWEQGKGVSQQALKKHFHQHVGGSLA